MNKLVLVLIISSDEAECKIKPYWITSALFRAHLLVNHTLRSAPRKNIGAYLEYGPSSASKRSYNFKSYEQDSKSNVVNDLGAQIP